MNKGLRIKHAIYLNGWTFESGDVDTLFLRGQKVTPEQYENGMQDKIFCPRCLTNLSRSPQDKAISSSRISAHFKHRRSYGSIECKLRTGKTIGRNFKSEEDVAEAIENKELVTVNGFLQSIPEEPLDGGGDFVGDFVEDVSGPVVDLPIGRHRGETVEVPSVITTIRGITKNFNVNLNKYFHLPYTNSPIKLVDLISSSIHVTSVSEVAKIYYGEIISANYPAKNPSDHHLLMIEVDSASEVPDFNLKVRKDVADQHGLSGDSVGRYVLFYGVISENGIGLSIDRPAYGEIALIPKKYDNYLL